MSAQYSIKCRPQAAPWATDVTWHCALHAHSLMRASPSPGPEQHSLAAGTTRSAGALFRDTGASYLLVVDTYARGREAQRRRAARAAYVAYLLIIYFTIYDLSCVLLTPLSGYLYLLPQPTTTIPSSLAPS
eukprot:scaffold5756_cov123-Isochrysis_galbana.AAC.3